jgi:hypothetical protein
VVVHGSRELSLLCRDARPVEVLPAISRGKGLVLWDLVGLARNQGGPEAAGHEGPCSSSAVACTQAYCWQIAMGCCLIELNAAGKRPAVVWQCNLASYYLVDHGIMCSRNHQLSDWPLLIHALPYEVMIGRS